MSANTASIPTVRPIAVSPGDALHPRGRAAVVLILGLLVALGPFTTDLYLPAFPAVQASFGTTDVALQLTLTATILGFALGQLVVGPLSDRFGRRMPLLIATSVHVLTCLGAAMAPNVEVLSALRLLQGMGAAGGGVVAAAMVRGAVDREADEEPAPVEHRVQLRADQRREDRRGAGHEAHVREHPDQAVFPCVQVLGLLHHGEEAGTAASLLGVGNFGLAAITPLVVGLLGASAASSIGAVAAVGGALAALALLLLIRPRTVPPIG